MVEGIVSLEPQHSFCPLSDGNCAIEREVPVVGSRAGHGVLPQVAELRLRARDRPWGTGDAGLPGRFGRRAEALPNPSSRVRHLTPRSLRSLAARPLIP